MNCFIVHALVNRINKDKDRLGRALTLLEYMPIVTLKNLKVLVT